MRDYFYVCLKVIAAFLILTVVLYVIQDPVSNEQEPVPVGPNGPNILPGEGEDLIQAIQPPSTSQEEIDMIARVVYGQARGIYDLTEQACVVWVILNRVDNWGESIESIIQSPHQFYYKDTFPMVDDYGRDLRDLVKNVISIWESEAQIGRVLPSDYMWMHGDGAHNYFRNAYDGDYSIWDYSLQSPYAWTADMR